MLFRNIHVNIGLGELFSLSREGYLTSLRSQTPPSTSPAELGVFESCKHVRIGGR